MARTKKVEKPKAKQETGEVITDIIEEFFMQDGQEFVKRTFMAKDKFIKEEIVSVK
jgi:hypothetical protein